MNVQEYWKFKKFKFEKTRHRLANICLWDFHDSEVILPWDYGAFFFHYVLRVEEHKSSRGGAPYRFLINTGIKGARFLSKIDWPINIISARYHKISKTCIITLKITCEETRKCSREMNVIVWMKVIRNNLFCAFSCVTIFQEALYQIYHRIYL